MNLSKPARYVPFACGRYEIAPGLSKFGKDVSNGRADQQVFQFDTDFPRYRACKLASRNESFERHVCAFNLADAVRDAVAGFMRGRLCEEHRPWFEVDHDGKLLCRLTGQSVSFERDPLDALALQVQEDLAIVSSSHNGHHWLSFLHLCFPNHWAAADKIGKPFAAIHAPVAGIAPINRRADVHVKTMIAAEQGLVRFAWGIGTDDLLNHHPDLDRATDARRFDPNHPRAFVRVERQTIWGFPTVGAALFTIRTYFTDCAELKRDDPATCRALASAIESMTPESVQYKGLAPWRDHLLSWLRA